MLIRKPEGFVNWLDVIDIHCVLVVVGNPHRLIAQLMTPVSRFTDCLGPHVYRVLKWGGGTGPFMGDFGLDTKF